MRAGTLHEAPAEMGVSHLLEHMVFKGTRSRSAREIALSLETLGGSLDAYTEREHTSYQARVLDAHLADAAAVIGDLLFDPLLRPGDLRLEQKVVLEEISMVEDTPDDIIFDVFNEALWGDHPHGFPILGTRDTVKALSAEQLRSRHATGYVPGRVVVAAAGCVEHERLLEVLHATGWADRPVADPAPWAVDPAEPAAPHATHISRRDIGQTHVVLGGVGLRHGDPRRFAFALLDMLLGGGMSSRLFQRVREDLGLAYSVHTFSTAFADTGVHGIYLASAPESAQEALDAARAVLRETAAAGLTPAELAAGKQQLRGQLVLGMEGIGARMYRAASTALYGEPFRSVDELMAEVDAIDEALVGEVAREYFDPDRHLLVSLGPRGVR
ncbi:MAG: insulinase family protein [Gemmatimonadetes bacterium]|nr:insulinase family protein [Gemmatimonadota bacterium]